ncbi:MAG: glycerate kinase [Bacteroidales bacterium]|nr:glycerate kinase [Bacteroidales bacterium]
MPRSCLTGALGAKIDETRVSDPLGRTFDARFATLGDTGIIEIAQACGLHLLASAERNRCRSNIAAAAWKTRSQA